MGRFEVLHSPHWNYIECSQAFSYTLEDFLSENVPLFVPW